MRSTNENIRLLKPFLRGIPLIVLVVAVCIAAARRYIKYATPMYESTAKIRLADTKDGSPSANLFKDFDVFANVNKIGAEIEVIKSQVLMNKALDSVDFDVSIFRIGQLKKIELYNESPVVINYSLATQNLNDKSLSLKILPDSSLTIVTGEGKSHKGKLGTPVYIDNDVLLITKNDALFHAKPYIRLADQYELIIHSRQKLISEVLEHTEVTSVDKEVPIIRINYKTAVARKSADFVNRLAQAYINDYVDTKIQSADIAVDFLNDQIREAGGKLASSENAIENFRDENSIINIRQETET